MVVLHSQGVAYFVEDESTVRMMGTLITDFLTLLIMRVICTSLHPYRASVVVLCGLSSLRLSSLMSAACTD